MNEKRAVLPSDIREAFHTAFGEFWRWRSGTEPVVAINRGPWPISWLCGLVLLYENERIARRLDVALDSRFVEYCFESKRNLDNVVE